MPADSLRATRTAVETEMNNRGIINGAHDTTGKMPTNSRSGSTTGSTSH